MPGHTARWADDADRTVERLGMTRLGLTTLYATVFEPKPSLCTNGDNGVLTSGKRCREERKAPKPNPIGLITLG